MCDLWKLFKDAHAFPAAPADPDSLDLQVDENDFPFVHEIHPVDKEYPLDKEASVKTRFLPPENS